MSILINMEMPESCADCLNIGWQYVFECNLDDVEHDERRADCPLIEVPIDYDKLLKAAKAMHTWIFLHSGNEELAYKACGLSDEMNAVLGYAGSFTVIPADKDGDANVP